MNRNRKKTPFSKAVVILAVMIAVCFIVWCCFEMHRLDDLSPVAYIGTSIIGMFAAVVSGYMWRAKQSDLYDLEMRKAQLIGKTHAVPRIPDDAENTENAYGTEGGDGE